MKGYLHRYLLLLVLFFSMQVSYAQLLCPPNLDFERGDYSNWEFYTGHCCPINTNTLSSPLPGRHQLKYGIDFDKYGGFPIVAPGGGTFSLKLGNDDAGYEAERARYYVQVPSGPGAYTLIYRYAVVFQDPGHLPSEQPKFEVSVYDSVTGQPIACNHHEYVASSNIPGFKKSTSPDAVDVYYKDWTTATIDFSGLSGHTVAIDFATADCGRGAHFGYGYIDLSCGFFQVKNVSCKPDPFINLEAPPGFQGYQWMDANFITSYGNTETVQIPTPSVTTRYAVILTPYQGFGCPDTMYTTVIKADLITDINNDTVICDGNIVPLQVRGNTVGMPLTYNWSPATYLSCTNCFNPVAMPKKTTTYTVTVTDTNGCNKQEDVRIAVRGAVDPTIKATPDTVCEFELVEVKSTGINPANAIYTWSVDSGKFNGDGTPEIVAQWVGAGTKKVVLSVHNQGCVEHDTVNIEVKKQPIASFDIADHSCTDQDVILNVVEQPCSYNWTIDEQDILDTVYQPSYTLSWHDIGEKFIRLELDANNGCYDTLETSINIYNSPEARITTDDHEFCYDVKFKFSTPEGNRYTYSWSPPQFFDANNSHTVTGYAERTGHIYLTVSNQWDCIAKDSFYVEANSCCDIFMPGAFTPNSDGINDVYNAVDIEEHDVIEFLILNRWGEVVYNSHGTNIGWDGTYKNKIAESGTYNYYIRYLCKGTKQVVRKGNLTLLK